MEHSTIDDMPPCEIFIDKEGRWFHHGAEIVRRDIIRHFYANMQRDSRGRYVLHWDGNACSVEVEDTAFVVRRVDGKETAFFLHLSDDSVERLSPETLSVGRENVLYCAVKNGRFPARFTRAAYYQLADHIEEGEEGGGFFLRAGERKHPILWAQQPHEKG
jgi:hypothetical protein